MYENGHGVSEDDKQAVKWFRLAAEQGYANAQFGLGFMYENGHGVSEDDKQAVKWFRLAAEQGYANAQNSLGLMYAKGGGVPEDKVLAYMWWNLTAANGNENASIGKDIIAKSMTSSQIAEAQKLSRECLKKEYKNCH
jgi:TPR repeat protein